jgi:hypothetical protein
MSDTQMVCNVCSCDFDIDKEGGIAGEFGILPVSFCPTCYASMCDMVEQLTFDDRDWVEVECPLCGEMAVAHTHPNLNKREWVGLTDEEMHECAGEYPWTPTGLKCARAIEAKLKEKNRAV